MRDVSNSEDTMDSRDVQERIEDLEGERGNLEDLREAVEDAQTAYNEAVDEDPDATAYIEEKGDELAAARMALREAEAWADNNPDEAEELEILLAFKSEAEGYCDWDGGETLVRESYWVEYVQELLEDIGDLPKDLPGYIAIDWDKTADNIKADYSEAEFDGVTYLFRCS